ncbi:unnamed protein product, partial [marine sediment metagenome]
GFNRAFLLLPDENIEFLEGKTAVGPSSYEEAWKIWQQVSEEEISLKDILYRKKDDEEYLTELTKRIKAVKIPINDKKVVGRTFLEKKPFNIKIAIKEFPIENEIGKLLDWEDFAIVPLLSRDRAVGVVIVDNHFNKRAITVEDINFLVMFANQAGLAIDNATVHKKLKESISSMEMANIKLQELKNYSENIVESITSAISVIDKNTMISSCNSSFENFIGLSKKEIIGRSLLKLPLKIEEFDLTGIIEETSTKGEPQELSKVHCIANNEEVIADISIYP